MSAGLEIAIGLFPVLRIGDCCENRRLLFHIFHKKVGKPGAKLIALAGSVGDYGRVLLVRCRPIYAGWLSPGRVAGIDSLVSGSTGCL